MHSVKPALVADQDAPRGGMRYRPDRTMRLHDLLSAPNPLPRHVIAIRQLDRGAIEHCFRVAQSIEQSPVTDYSNLLVGRVAAVLWFQQSFRTRLGFEVAMQRLGGRVSGFSDPSSSRSVGWYAESLEDVVRFGGSIVDIIFIRHFQTGAVARAAAISPVPVLNGGDGFGEHPSQALGDLYHLYKTFGTLDGLRMGIIGSLNWRVFRSLSFGLSKFDAELVLLPPPGEPGIPPDVAEELARAGTRYRIVSHVDEVLSVCDAVTTLGASQSEFDKSKSENPKGAPTPATHKITIDALRRAGREVMVMHVGPITDEIDREIDRMPYGRYFAEARDGMWMRMAVIASLLAGPRQPGR